MTTFGFLLVSASNLLSVVSTIRLYPESFDEIEDWRNRNVSLKKETLALLFIFLLVSLSTWLFAVVPIEKFLIGGGGLYQFYLNASVSMVSLLFMIGSVFFMMYTASRLQEENTFNALKTAKDLNSKV